MKEPEDTLTAHRIKRVFVVLLILRILWAVGTHQPQNEVVATITQVVQWPAAGNVVAKVTAVQNARYASSDVEFEPEVQVAEVTDKAEEFSAGNVVAKVTKAQNARNASSVVGFEPAAKIMFIYI